MKQNTVWRIIILVIALFIGLFGGYFIGREARSNKENDRYTIKVAEFKRFTRTYQVLNVAESKDDRYQYLTIRQFQMEEVETVKVEKDLNKNIKEDAFYEFTFEITDKYPQDEIQSIFKDTTVISIEMTDKTGLDQIQDPMDY